MTEIVTLNLSKFGRRELKLAEELLKAWREKGLPDDFESEEASFDASQRTSRTEFSLSRPFKTLFGSLGLRFKLDNQRFKSNPDRTQLDFSQTFSKSALRITHGNTFNLTDQGYQNSDGRINTTYRINDNWQFRSLLNYNIYPERKLRNVLSELRLQKDEVCHEPSPLK